MQILNCPICSTRVGVMRTGRCPACHALILESQQDLNTPDPKPEPQRTELTQIPIALSDQFRKIRELEDPMRDLGEVILRYAFRMIWMGPLLSGFVFCFAILMAIIESQLGVILASAVAVSTFGCSIVLFLAWVHLKAFIPNRITDVFYLRSFRNDDATLPIRQCIQNVLGQYRLSGIRDPGRRQATWADKFVLMFRILKYCTPRHMDLEAGSDWKARLWYSVQRGKAAIVDLSAPTPFVLEEIDLAMTALGRQRVIFVGHEPQSVESIQSVVAQQVANCEAIGEQVLIWPKDRRMQGPFQDAFRSIWLRILTLPPIVPTIPPDTFPSVRLIDSGDQRRAKQIFWTFVWFQLGLIVFSIVAGLALNLTVSDPGLRERLRFVFTIIMSLINFYLLANNYFVYLRDAGSRRRRVLGALSCLQTIGIIVFGYYLLWRYG